MENREEYNGQGDIQGSDILSPEHVATANAQAGAAVEALFGKKVEEPKQREAIVYVDPEDWGLTGDADEDTPHLSRNALYTAESFLYNTDFSSQKEAVRQAHDLLVMVQAKESDLEIAIKELTKEKEYYSKAVGRVKSFIAVHVEEDKESGKLPSATYFMASRTSVSYDHLMPDEFYWQLPTFVPFDKFLAEKGLSSIEQVTKTALSERKPIDPDKGITVEKRYLNIRKKKAE